MLVGKDISLRAMEDRDVADRVRWFNHPQVRATLGVDYPISEVGTRQWLQKSALDGNRLDLIVTLNETGKAVGCVGLKIERRHAKAEVYLAIGEPEAWGHGYGKEAVKIITQHGFHALGLNRVFAYTRNDRFVRLTTALGFQLEGTLRADVFEEGEFRDRFLLGVTKAEFLKVHGEAK